MCATCAVTEAAKSKDWDEVGRIAREQKKAEKADEKADEEPKAAASKASSKS